MAPIHDAARDRDVETLRRLLAEGVSPDAVDDEDRGETPLHTLCGGRLPSYREGDPAACFKLLRDAGANLDAVTRGGYTPLHVSLHFINVELVSLLVEAGANVNAASDVGNTALHYAASRRSLACVEVLLAAGADVNVRSTNWGTPFGTALARDHRRMLALYLRAGAQIPTNSTNPYIVRVRNAGGFKKYEQAHITRITAILAPTPRLPPELVRHVVDFWLHAGYY